MNGKKPESFGGSIFAKKYLVPTENLRRFLTMPFSLLCGHFVGEKKKNNKKINRETRDTDGGGHI